MRSSLISKLAATATLTAAVIAPLALTSVQPAGATEPSPVRLHATGLVPAAQRLAPRLSEPRAVGTLPPSVNLTRWALPIGDQGPVGSCVTWTIDYALMGWYSRHDAKAGQPFAPMYAYSQVAQASGGDYGATFGQVFDLAQQSGNETQARYPNGTFDYLDQPTAAQRQDARNYTISGWNTLFSGAGQGDPAVQSIKAALARKQPVALGIPVRAGFDELGTDPSAIVDDTTSESRGNHAVLALGYDSAGVLIQNSWGTGWGNQGFGRLSWNVIRADVFEAHTIDGFAVPTVQRTGERVLFGKAGARQRLTFGTKGDVPLTGDWNGDGRDTPGVFANGIFHLRNHNSTGAADLSIAFGAPGDVPVVGDWNGDGIDTIGVVRGNTWHLRNTNSPGADDLTFTYGKAGDVPVVGDWNGDHIDTPGTVHGDTWELRNRNRAGAPNITLHFGGTGAARATGDWNGDGIDTPAVVRGNVWSLRNKNSSGPAQSAATYGTPRYVPLAGRYVSSSKADAVGVAH